MGSKQIHILTGAQMHLLRRTQVDPTVLKISEINKQIQPKSCVTSL